MNFLRKYTMLSLILVTAVGAQAQQASKFIREGNRRYEKKKFDESETSYRKAQEKNKEAFEPSFNIGDALYKQGKFNEAANQFEMITEHKLKDKDLAQVYHNLGNSFLNEKKYKESIEAYKNALRKSPADKETKYNLSYALKMLQQQQQQNKDKKKDQNKDENKDQKKDQNKDQKKDQNKDQKKEDQKNQQQNQQQNQQKQNISKEDAQRILQSLQNDEKKLLEKVKRQEAAKSKKTTSKDW
jgi:Ca-activated chloride channel homolog